MAVFVLTNAVFSTPTYAAYTQDDSYFDSNEIFFYCKPADAGQPPNKCENTTCANGNSTSSGTSVPVSLTDLKKTDSLQRIFQGLLGGGMNAVQAAAVMGNMYTESGHGFDPNTYEGGVDTGTDGFGLVQWTGGRRTLLENYASSQNTPKASLALQMNFLLAEYDGKISGGLNYGAALKNTAFGTGTNVIDATRAWMQIYEGPKQIGSDPAKINSERIPAAEKIYSFYSNLAPITPAASASASQSGCSSSGGVSATSGGGNIVQTALSLAWPQSKGIVDGNNQVSDATTAYQAAKPKYDTEGLVSDCGAFVSVVMRMSGVDPNWPTLGVHTMGPYARAHPELYKIIENAKQSDLQSGDIVIEYSFDHIVISQGAGHPNIDASNNARVPSVRPDGSDMYMILQGSFIARYIGPKA